MRRLAYLSRTKKIRVVLSHDRQTPASPREKSSAPNQYRLNPPLEFIPERVHAWVG
jgi:hypothetical protein